MMTGQIKRRAQVKASFSSARENMDEIKELSEMLGVSEDVVKSNLSAIRQKVSAVTKAQKEKELAEKDGKIEASFEVAKRIATLAYRLIEEENPLPGSQFEMKCTIAEDGEILLAAYANPKNATRGLWILPNGARSSEKPKVSRGYNKKMK